MSDLKIKNLKKVFEGIEIIKGVDLEIKDHEFVVFVGPSGCGKSTLLRLIAGLEEVTSGQIFLDSKEITDMAPARRDLAMVFQTYALYPHMTVRKNMSFALDLAGIDKREIDAKVSEAARILELEPLLERKPKALSGGQRQRVAIGRAIVRQPKIFLFDEPLSNLDAALRVQVGSPLELYHHPVNRFVAGFIGTPKMGFMQGRVVTAGADEVTLTLGCGHQVTLPVNGEGLATGAPVTLGVRPEHLSITTPEESGLLAALTVSEHLGADTFCYVEMAAGELLTVRAGGDFQGQYGSRVGLKIDLSQCHLFDEDGQALKRIKQMSTFPNQRVAL